MQEGQPRCTVHWWSSTDLCPVEPGEHTCVRDDEHRTHVCVCEAMRTSPPETPGGGPVSDDPADAANRCGYRWSEGRTCSSIAHTCDREDDHETHVCACLATDTPTRAGARV
jgi:hypothetical protein